ncbi:MAG: hypothetical protein COA65_06820 [Rhodospirillaceae bacterium]|nr:MAG: hypothetical protein COA65_06820 [Rhodospirillaceae bacterium]
MTQASYGVGTSGIMFEILAMDGVVVATRFEWGVARFGDNPNVVWLDDVEPVTIQNALKEAARLVASDSRAQLPDDFTSSWHAAIQQACASLPKKRFDAHGTGR